MLLVAACYVTYPLHTRYIDFFLLLVAACYVTYPLHTRYIDFFQLLVTAWVWACTQKRVRLPAMSHVHREEWGNGRPPPLPYLFQGVIAPRAKVSQQVTPKP